MLAFDWRDHRRDPWGTQRLDASFNEASFSRPSACDFSQQRLQAARFDATYIV